MSIHAFDVLGFITVSVYPLCLDYECTYARSVAAADAGMRIAGGNETIVVPTALKDSSVSKAVPAWAIKTGTAKSAALPRVRREADAWLLGDEVVGLVG